MEIVQAIGWITLGFGPTVLALRISSRLAKAFTGRKEEFSKSVTIAPIQPALLMQGHGLEEADFEGFAPLPEI